MQTYILNDFVCSSIDDEHLIACNAGHLLKDKFNSMDANVF